MQPAAYFLLLLGILWIVTIQIQINSTRFLGPGKNMLQEYQHPMQELCIKKIGPAPSSNKFSKNYATYDLGKASLHRNTKIFEHGPKKKHNLSKSRTTKTINNQKLLQMT